MYKLNFKVGMFMKVKWLLVMLFFVSTHTFAAELKDINVDQLKTLIASGVTVIDIRTPGEWEQTGIVDGSIPIMFFDEKGKPHTEAWIEKVLEHIEVDSQLALICRSGNRTRMVGNYLVKQRGFQQVYNVKGGIKSWIAKGNTTSRVK